MTHLDPKALEAVWQAIVEKDDRTSPEEYPDMALISLGELEEAISAYLAALPQAEPVAPEGWVLVPREPTEAMLDAGVLGHPGELSYEDAALCYDAMLFASPTPAVSREPEITPQVMAAFRESYREHREGKQYLPVLAPDFIEPALKAAFTAALSQPHSEK